MTSTHDLGPALPSFTPVARLRPVALVQPDAATPLAPYLAAEVDLPDPTAPGIAELTFGDDRFAARWNGRTLSLRVTQGGAWRNHASRRHATGRTPDAVAITLTGPFVTGWLREDGAWVARGVVDLVAERTAIDVHDEDWLARFEGVGDRSGCFGQLGLRDIRVVTHADGTPYRCADGGEVLLTATSAGPGGFRTAHTSVWSFSPPTLPSTLPSTVPTEDGPPPSLTHRGDLFFRRPPEDDVAGVFGDHATHLVRDGDRWLVATSTWGTFDPKRDPHVSTTLATSTADLTAGQHVLDTVPLDLPTTGLTSVGRWDPHLVRRAATAAEPGGDWLVGFVSAERWFRFHPVLASGPDLDSLSFLAATPDRLACEGTTLTEVDGRWWVLASDGPDSRRSERQTYPIFDLELTQHGVLDADYPSNIPWPTTLPPAPGAPSEQASDWSLIGFDSTPYGGPLLGYGTHGDVCVQRAH
ncbi:hypothetical protein [Nocardioides sp.]|uniref:hypothetical protein n=1 Tax=Nocardioides sp. TaxID=35761 RepID=UPI002B26B90F|nr:hypothetical protein [Nocardioides sp.]